LPRLPLQQHCCSLRWYTQYYKLQSLISNFLYFQTIVIKHLYGFITTDPFRHKYTTAQLKLHDERYEDASMTAEHLNPLNAQLNPICHLLALLGAHHILHVSRIRVNHVTFSTRYDV
jgi:hypothetical protein